MTEINININGQPVYQAAPQAPQNPVFSYSTSQLQTEVREFARSTDLFAQGLLGEVTSNNTYSREAPTVVHNHYHENPYSSSWGWWFWPRPTQTVYINNNCSDSSSSRSSFWSSSSSSSSRCENTDSKKKNKNDNSAALIVLGLTAIVGAGVAIYQVGKAFGEFNSMQDEIQTTRNFKAKMLKYQNSDLSPKERKLVETAIATADLRERLGKNLANSTTANFHNNSFVGAGLFGLAASSAMHLSERESFTPSLPYVIALSAGSLLWGLANKIMKCGIEAGRTQRPDLDALLTKSALIKFEANCL